MRLEMLLRAPQRLVDAAERAAAIAGHEARRVEAGATVALVLQHQQAHQRLRTAHVGTALVERVLVVEGDAAERVVEFGREVLRGDRGVHRGVLKNRVFGIAEAARMRRPAASTDVS